MPRIATTRTVERAELEAFIRPRHHGVLITVRADGLPQSSPVTMGLTDDGVVVVSTYPERAKAVNVERRPIASMLVLSDDFGEEWVQVDGRATVVRGPEAVEGLVEYYRAVSGEHPDWDEYRQAMVLQAKCLIRLEIDRWGPIAGGGFPPDVAARLADRAAGRRA